jgi:acetyltransferase
VVTPGAPELVIFLGGAEVEKEERAKLYARGVPVFPTPERGVKALAQFFRFQEKPVVIPHAPTHAEPEAAPRPMLRLLPANEAAAMVAQAGIPAAAAPLAADEEEAVRLAHDFGYPVALKVSSPDIVHKSDMGGVALNLRNAEAVRHAYKDIMASTRLYERWARVDGVSVSPMAKPGGLELILGIVTDPQYGPCLMFGMGGTYTELYKDVAFCLLPASEADLDALIKRIKAYPLLTGFRGQPRRDLEALKTAMQALERMAGKHPELDQIELNPVLLYTKGLFAVDVRIFSRI